MISVTCLTERTREEVSSKVPWSTRSAGIPMRDAGEADEGWSSLRRISIRARDVEVGGYEEEVKEEDGEEGEGE